MEEGNAQERLNLEIRLVQKRKLSEMRDCSVGLGKSHMVQSILESYNRALNELAEVPGTCNFEQRLLPVREQHLKILRRIEIQREKAEQLDREIKFYEKRLYCLNTMKNTGRSVYNGSSDATMAHTKFKMHDLDIANLNFSHRRKVLREQIGEYHTLLITDQTYASDLTKTSQSLMQSINQLRSDTISDQSSLERIQERRNTWLKEDKHEEFTNANQLNEYIFKLNILSQLGNFILTKMTPLNRININRTSISKSYTLNSNEKMSVNLNQVETPGKNEKDLFSLLQNNITLLSEQSTLVPDIEAKKKLIKEYQEKHDNIGNLPLVESLKETVNVLKGKLAQAQSQLMLICRLLTKMIASCKLNVPMKGKRGVQSIVYRSNLSAVLSFLYQHLIGLIIIHYMNHLSGEQADRMVVYQLHHLVTLTRSNK